MSSIDALLTSTNLRRNPAPRSESGLSSVYLHAGQLHVSAVPTEITTVLGSCIAICAWDPTSGVGGMCHYMLPYEVGGKNDSPRYASFAINELFDQIIANGGDRQRIQARVYGGGTMLNTVSSANDLGGKNAAAAFEYLEKARIPVVEEDVRGNHGRRVVFHTADGGVSVRRVG